MKKIAILVIAAMGTMIAGAENKVDTLQSGAVAEKHFLWKNSISTGLTLKRGNKNSALFSADFSTLRKTPTDEYLIGLSGTYGQQDSKNTINQEKCFAQWNHLFTPKFFSYTRLDGLQDHIKNLDYRITIGPGLGYYLMKNTNTTLAVEGGAGFEAQRLGGVDEAFATVRLADRFEYRLSERARLWQSLELLPQADTLNNFIINFEVGIETVISKTFSLKTYLADSYANKPAARYVKNDAKIVTGVSYKF